MRGQSNALLFADRGGAAALERGLEARLGAGVDVHMLYEWGTNTSTIHSGTAFMRWDTDGQQASLLRYVRALPASTKDDPTATVWMHNEFDQENASLTRDAWLSEVRADAALVHGALGQDAATTPYTFVPIRYPTGTNFASIGDGMAALDADASFNAEISWAAQSLTMDGDGWANSSHMGDADAVKLGGDLAASMAETLRPLVNGSAPPPTTTPPPPTTPPPATNQPTSTTIGTGPDTLVLKISQDAYQGNAQYTVQVDGRQIGGTLTASALRSAGQSDTVTVAGDWAGGAHTATVTFLNDAWGGSASTDRNLYVNGATYNGATLSNATAALEREGPARLSFTDTDPAAPGPQPPTTQPSNPQPANLTVGSGPDKLVLSISQDAYQGSAQYTVQVDGRQVGGTLTASALRSAGQHDTVTVQGDWAGGRHTATVTFLNDDWGGTATTDRNLYLDGATYNNAAVSGATASLMSNGSAGFSFLDPLV